MASCASINTKASHSNIIHPSIILANSKISAISPADWRANQQSTAPGGRHQALPVTHRYHSRERRAKEMLVEPKTLSGSNDMNLLSNFQMTQDHNIDTV